MGLQDRDYLKDRGSTGQSRPQLDPKVWKKATSNGHRGWAGYLVWTLILGLIWYGCNLYLESNGYIIKRIVNEISSHGPWIKFPQGMLFT